MEFTQQNLDFFQHHDLALLCELTKPQAEGIAVELARRGGWTLKASGRYVHSKYDPVKEAEGLVGSNSESELHIHFGFGLGYFLRADRGSPQSVFVIYEPNPAFVVAAMSHMPLAEWFAEKKIHLTCDIARFRALLGSYLKPGMQLRVVLCPYHKQCHTRELKGFSLAISRERNKQLMNQGKFSLQRRLSYWHTLASLRYWAGLPGLEQIKNRFQGKMAVVVSPGPSLERNLCDLVPYAERVLLFAPTRSAKLMEKVGIRPHFLVHNEPQDFFSFVDGCTQLDDTIFLLAEQTHEAYFRLPQLKLVYQNQANLATNWLCEAWPALVRQKAITAGSVATEAFFAAYLAGCDPIVLMGQDLAVQGAQFYSGSEFNLNFAIGGADERKTAGYFGGQVRTFAHYLHFLDWYENTLAHFHKADPRRLFINATEGGASITGFEQKSLRESLYRWANLEAADFLSFRESVAGESLKNIPSQLGAKIVEVIERQLKPLAAWCATADDLSELLSLVSAFPLVKAALDQEGCRMLEELESDRDLENLETGQLAQRVGEALQRWYELLGGLQG